MTELQPRSADLPLAWVGLSGGGVGNPGFMDLEALSR